MKSKIITIVFLTSLLLQNLTEAQFEFKQFLNDNKVSVSIILALLCGGYYMHAKHKSEKGNLNDEIQIKRNIIDKNDILITKLQKEKSDLEKANSEMKQDVEDYQSINDRRTKNKQGVWVINTYYNDTFLHLGFISNEEEQTNYLKDTIKKNKETGKIPEIKK